jgi:hypothetical protein
VTLGLLFSRSGATHVDIFFGVVSHLNSPHLPFLPPHFITSPFTLPAPAHVTSHHCTQLAHSLSDLSCTLKFIVLSLCTAPHPVSRVGALGAVHCTAVSALASAWAPHQSPHPTRLQESTSRARGLTAVPTAGSVPDYHPTSHPGGVVPTRRSSSKISISHLLHDDYDHSPVHVSATLTHTCTHAHTLSLLPCQTSLPRIPSVSDVYFGCSPVGLPPRGSASPRCVCGACVCVCVCVCVEHERACIENLSNESWADPCILTLSFFLVGWI